MRNIYHALIAFTITTIHLSIADLQAQVPQSINYQAVVRNTSGNIIPNQPVGLRFTIHDGSAGGTIVYCETNTDTTNQFGLFTTAIGSGNVISGTFSAISWGSANKYLQVEIDVSGGNNYINMGTTQLISVPYALYAQTSGSSVAGPTGATGPQGNNGINGPGYLATSVSTITIGTGSKTMTTQTGLAYLPIDRVRISASPTDYVEGIVTVYSGTTLTVNVDRVVGGGTFSGWNIGIAGDVGDTGPAGVTGATGLRGVTGATGNTGVAGSANAWGLTGNTGTTDGTNFIGTTDDVPLTIRINNQTAGRIETTTGNHNVSIGYQSLQSNTSTANSAFGCQAMFSNVDAGQNTGIGYQALYSNVSSWGNTAVGHQALYNNTSFGNTAVGQSVLLQNTSGNYNTAMGAFTLLNNQTGNSNTAIGKIAMQNNIGGSSNTAIGQEALFTNTTGNFNTASGQGALYLNTGSDNTANGYLALNANGTGGDNTAVGMYALYANTSGGSNTAIGVNALSGSTTGSNNTGLGFNSQVPNTAGSNQVRVGNTFVTYAGVQVGWTITSDRRWKSEIQNSNLGLDFIDKLRPVSYVRNNDESRKFEYGFIAQEVEEALSSSGVSNSGVISKDDEGMFGLRYNDFIAPMVKAIQELAKQNKELKKEIEELKKN